MLESYSLSNEAVSTECPACSRVLFQSAMCLTSPLQSTWLHAGNYLYFWSSKLCSLECSEVMAGTFTFISVVIQCVCLWSFGAVHIIRKQLEPFCFQLSRYCLPLRNMLEFNKFVYMVENLPYLGLSLTHMLTKWQFSERESSTASKWQVPSTVLFSEPLWVMYLPIAILTYGPETSLVT